MPTDERLIVNVVDSLKAMTLILTCANSEGGLSSKMFLVAKAGSKENIRDAFESAGTTLGSKTSASLIIVLKVAEGVTTAGVGTTCRGTSIVAEESPTLAEVAGVREGKLTAARPIINNRCFCKTNTLIEIV